jgi:hypothetical protein
MHSNATLFCLLFEGWEAAQQRADNAWGDVWDDVHAWEAHGGARPSEHQIATAARLDEDAREWLITLCRELRLQRKRTAIL